MVYTNIHIFHYTLNTLYEKSNYYLQFYDHPDSKNVNDKKTIVKRFFFNLPSSLNFLFLKFLIKSL